MSWLIAWPISFKQRVDCNGSFVNVIRFLPVLSSPHLLFSCQSASDITLPSLILSITAANMSQLKNMCGSKALKCSQQDIFFVFSAGEKHFGGQSPLTSWKNIRFNIALLLLEKSKAPVRTPLSFRHPLDWIGLCRWDFEMELCQKTFSLMVSSVS